MLRCHLLCLFTVAAAAPAQDPHAICTTTTDLAALCRAIGGDRVAVTCLTRPADDPHFVEARPSMIRAVHGAELLVCVGRELEVGWLPLLQEQARNPDVLPGAKGLFVAADQVRALGVPTGPVDRSQGDVHAGGNPHFLADPLCGLQVAVALSGRFGELWPDERALYATRCTAFTRALAVALVGEDLAQAYDHATEKLLLLLGQGKLDAVLAAQGDRARLQGIAAQLLPLRGTKVVADHDLWPYFAERFGLQVCGTLEPKPGVPPGTAHLEAIVRLVREQRVAAVVTAPYFPAVHAEFVAKVTGVRIAALAHQCGAAPGTDDYLAFVDHNVRTLVAALAAPAASGERR